MKEVKSLILGAETFDLMDEKARPVLNVATMKSMTNLVPGNVIKTLGYYEPNDGGASLYLIKERNSEHIEDNGSIHFVGENLVAEIIESECIMVNQFGAYGDEEHDDTDLINNALKYASEHNIQELKFIKGKTYLVRGYEEGQVQGSTTGLTATTGLITYSNSVINLNGATIKCITNNRTNYNIFTIANCENVVLKNGFIIGDVDTHTGTTGEWGYGVSIRYAKNVILDNLHVSKCWGDGINLNHNGDIDLLSENIVISNCICDDNRRQGMSVESVDNLHVMDCEFINTGKTKFTAPASGVDVEPSGSYVKNVIFDNCIFKDNYNSGLIIDGKDVSNVVVNHSKIVNNSGTTSQSNFAIVEGNDIKIMNSIIDKQNGYGSCPIHFTGDVEFINNKFINTRIALYSKGSDKIIAFKGNSFNSNIDLTWNSLIETVGVGTAQSGNVLIFEDNIIKYEKSAPIRSLLYVMKEHYFEKLICKNNRFYNGKVAIISSCSSEIENNNFICSKTWTLQLAKVNNANDLSVVNHIKNNIFEHSGCSTNTTTIINNITTANLILSNNIAYKHCTNLSDESSDFIYSASAFLQKENDSGIHLNENNHILDNSQSA